MLRLAIGGRDLVESRGVTINQTKKFNEARIIGSGRKKRKLFLTTHVKPTNQTVEELRRLLLGVGSDSD